MAKRGSAQLRAGLNGPTQKATSVLYAAGALALFVFAAALLVIAILEVVQSFGDSLKAMTLATLDSIGLIIIAVATLDLGKFLVEEELIRRRELRSPREARRSLTKFITIIIIAVSLEAIVLVFQVKTEGATAELIYPASLLASGVFALIGLALFQWLSTSADLARKEVHEGRPPED